MACLACSLPLHRLSPGNKKPDLKLTTLPLTSRCLPAAFMSIYAAHHENEVSMADEFCVACSHHGSHRYVSRTESQKIVELISAWNK